TPVDSNKMIVFDNNGRFSSNGAICSFAAAVNENVEGTYEIFSNTEFRINCAEENLDYVALFLENQVLIVNYPCIEPCSHKYIKID
ncbi:MAG: hypothetical protein HKP38_04390, partial [Croceitalea sp.]|nr:hypothetical protein [Croceitalea sp.]